LGVALQGVGGLASKGLLTCHATAQDPAIFPPSFRHGYGSPAWRPGGQIRSFP